MVPYLVWVPLFYTFVSIIAHHTIIWTRKGPHAGTGKDVDKAMTCDILATLHSPADVQRLDDRQLDECCAQIRETLVEFGKRAGGHIGSNLGLVETSVALHVVFDSPLDKIVFDVSHQSYVHKMLTGRAEAFLNAELFGSVTGFTNPAESEHDHFVLGHTGTSISLACGLAKERDMVATTGAVPQTRNVIAVIGDGALSSAIAFEGLNNAAEQGGNLIIIVNDNEMSIAENHGGMYATLAEMRASHGRSDRNLFTVFGLDYRYVEHGNDVHTMIEALREVKDIDHPVVLHVHTTKGLGLDAEDARHGVCAGRCEENHWQNPLAQEDTPLGARKYYGALAMDALAARFEHEPGLIVISPATPGSNGITHAFRAQAGPHYVDTGITEEHAVAFASGIAKAGGRPVVATSATFFQRTFDQVQQEVALNGTPVTLLSFGAGLSDADNTHSGAFDVPFFGNIPGLLCLAPTSRQMFLDMLAWSTSERNSHPVLIRVPGNQILGGERSGTLDPDATVEPQATDANNPWCGYHVAEAGDTVAVLGLGNAYPLARDVVHVLASDDTDPVHATLIDPLQFSTLDETTLRALASDHTLVVTLEDAQLEGGWGEKITAFYANMMPGSGMRTLNFGADKAFTDRTPLATLNSRYGLTCEAVTARIRSVLR
ncbi:1-deoxy-D-xylulose-5-phosphate synthase [Bifidobacterium pseudolongum subsp. globosum]|uniref:1-deoxy-D-xylulose-5-phosphate synthase n=2 Tax=Bifidobacterium pseudolongum TaxID=1694 RepID=A0A2N3QSC7_9BIFI|nr:1-deoxy-D-xylulose-5-phosphate synthase [Bifidobacterium pseudolongum subsp. globosum]PKV04536.1 1-deoxy-D-xylulose-5-phosphate synthase [Bifidobacterium pseudolongum subsp. globosum]RYQ75210.1 1-deoxy-D-xylulose-5-phosphate synthase [Bifidobacterium pseudolongum subsp. globosum]RYQ76637.1 1-deoxy-D-xylulose-5-phosphate synthase [Bifidobacterium pseudolongum subsp. globosum]